MALVRAFRWIMELITGPFRQMEGAGVPVRILLAFLGAGLLIHALIRLGRHAARQAARDPVAADLPGARRGEEWFWRRAEVHVARGAFGPAMLAAFHAAMLSLDARGLLTYRASATPRELLARARLDAARRGRFAELLGALYRTAFAAEPISPDQYQRWVHALREVSDAPAA